MLLCDREMNYRLLISLIFCIPLLIVGCKSTTVQNIEGSSFSTGQSASLSQIRQAISRACLNAGWKVKSSSQRQIIASYSYKRNKFGAVVRIPFNRHSYDILYMSSHNLKYQEAKLNMAEDNLEESDNFWEDSQQFFTENNPFKKSSNANHTAKRSPTIHKIYNQWVAKLDKSISRELNSINGRQVVTSNYSKSSASRSTAPKLPNTTCIDQPSISLNGQGTITKSSVNLRSGASTQCEIVGSVQKGQTFSIRGQKNNWLFISHNQNLAWIYAPLVVELNDTPTATVQANTSVTPNRTPPPPPSRNISVAVIHFKTLNNEAQKISLGDLVSETFTSALVNSRGFKIIEREQLDKVVKEMEMTQTGFIETTDAVQIGKMLHADAIITGSVALLNNQIQLNARIIEIESAYVISAETRTATYTLQNVTNMANDIVQNLSQKLIKNTR